MKFDSAVICPVSAVCCGNGSLQPAGPLQKADYVCAVVWAAAFIRTLQDAQSD